MIQLETITRFHRAQDSYMSFHVLTEDGMQRECSIRVSELETMFPQVIEALAVNGFFSINSYSREGYRAKTKTIAGLPRPLRRRWNARYINAAFCDCDAHKIGIDSGRMAGHVLSMQRRGEIPPPSVLSHSGRGLWMFWLLTSEHDPTMPPTAHPHSLTRFDGIQYELVHRVSRHLREVVESRGGEWDEAAVDLGARDFSRVTRIPGSLNGKCGLPVYHLVQLDAPGRMPTYTLSQLATFLNLDIGNGGTAFNFGHNSLPAATHQDPWRERAAPRSELHATRYQSMAENQYYAFQELRRLRGNFRADYRNNAAHIFAWILKINSFKKTSIEELVRKLGRECRPPLTQGEIMSAVKYGMRIGRMSYRCIADKLGVTQQEAQAIPAYLGPLPPGVQPQTVSPKDRRQLILELITTSGRLLPSRQVVAALAHKGIATDRTTVSRDCKAIFKNKRPPASQFLLAEARKEASHDLPDPHMRHINSPSITGTGVEPNAARHRTATARPGGEQ